MDGVASVCPFDSGVRLATVWGSIPLDHGGEKVGPRAR